MFTPGRIIFALIFIVVFIGLMIFAYGKDKKNHKTYYNNAAKKVALYGLIVIALFVLFRYFTSR